MTRGPSTTLLAVALVTLAAAGCGIKGPLTLPEKPENIVIRAPGTRTAPAEARRCDARTRRLHRRNETTRPTGETGSRTPATAAPALQQSRHWPGWLTPARWCSSTARRTCTEPSTRCRR